MQLLKTHCISVRAKILPKAIKAAYQIIPIRYLTVCFFYELIFLSPSEITKLAEIVGFVFDHFFMFISTRFVVLSDICRVASFFENMC